MRVIQGYEHRNRFIASLITSASGSVANKIKISSHWSEKGRDGCWPSLELSL